MCEKVVFIGCGDIGSRAALLLKAQSIEVLAVRRNTAKLPNNLPSMAADVLQPDSLQFLSQSTADTVVYSLAASGFNEASYTSAYIDGLRNTIAACDFSKVKRLIFVSSTAVYHQNDGSLVDENSATQPTMFNGKIMLEAEQLVHSTNVGTAVRFSGIYGPGRMRLIDRVRNGQCTAEDTDVFTNRIHVSDCAGLLAHLVSQPTLPKVVIGSDSHPVTSNEVESFIAGQLGIEKKYTANSGNQPKRMAGSKRCSNTLMLKTGYPLQYPDYRSGYQEMVASIQKH